MQTKPRYKKLKITPPFDEDFKNIPDSMKSLYTQKLVMVNTESNDNISPETLNNLQSDHLNQKLSLKKEDCDKMFVGINNFKSLEGWLEDTDRIEPYREAIMYNKYKFQNKMVYDINSPYGLFGMFALQNGARFVIVTCQKNFSRFVSQIYRDNGFSEEQFLVIEEPLNKVELTKLTEKESTFLENVKKNKLINIILGEWHGSVLVNCKTVKNIINVRDQYLNQSGCVFPNKGTLVMNFIEDSKYYEERFGFWNEVYGFDMRNVKEKVYQEACLDYCDPNMVKTYNNNFYTLDLNTAGEDDLSFVRDFRCKVKSDTFVHAAMINFKIMFEGCHFDKFYTNSCFGKKINFSQCILYLRQPFKVRKGGVISGKLALLGDLQHPEKLKVKLLTQYTKKNDQIQYFHVD